MMFHKHESQDPLTEAAAEASAATEAAEEAFAAEPVEAAAEAEAAAPVDTAAPPSKRGIAWLLVGLVAAGVAVGYNWLKGLPKD
ncbi:MAG: hypothetical protein JW990_11160 [Thermoleophilia bacterium]|nr:hypothetical protein [Thermoleophilia bacterium]